ncbi:MULTISPECIES: transposase [Gemella]|uniref:transposase n=1 Tax=Gemella TaxID=1378 RepID=UPI000930102A|nr:MULTISPECIES: transposase [Gemella]
MTEKQEAQTKEERAIPRKPDGILTKKMNGKTFVTEIYFDKKSKDTFQDKLLKIVQSERKE